MFAVARTGLPSGLNIVYLTLTDFKNPLNSERDLLLPHCSFRICGCGFFLLIEWSLGLSQPRSVLMSSIKSASGFSQSSKNSSIDRLWGCTPPNSGLVECFALLLVGRFQV